MWEERAPQLWTTSFPLLPTLSKKKVQIAKARITYKRPTTFLLQLTQYKHLALGKTSKQNFVRAMQTLCTNGCHGKYQIPGTTCFTNRGKN